MKTLTQHEMDQVNGAGIFGSALGALGLTFIGKTINDFENSILEQTVGHIPGVGSVIVDILRDPFGAFKESTPIPLSKK